ncbi:hypothetical protein [Streptomyces sp. adm13(2018)]|uniref:hypothetical protein n=1 Tax=Streptomyces sp. adm13(2018) TaxID=2479007 RepID=UPI00164F72A1|nr:hypothetical protein [Streptomyces sp. adm13(2018)]
MSAARTATGTPAPREPVRYERRGPVAGVPVDRPEYHTVRNRDIRSTKAAGA